MRVLRTMLPSRTKTATGGDNGDNREGRDISEARGPVELYLNVTAISGGPTVTFNVSDGFYIERTKGTTLGTVGPVYRTGVLVSPPGITATGLYLFGTLSDYGTLLQFSWTFAGGASPSITFEIYAVYEAAD